MKSVLLFLLTKTAKNSLSLHTDTARLAHDHDSTNGDWARLALCAHVSERRDEKYERFSLQLLSSVVCGLNFDGLVGFSRNNRDILPNTQFSSYRNALSLMRESIATTFPPSIDRRPSTTVINFELALSPRVVSIVFHHLHTFTFNSSANERSRSSRVSTNTCSIATRLTLSVTCARLTTMHTRRVRETATIISLRYFWWENKRRQLGK